MLTLMAYLEGVVNKWCSEILAERGETNEHITKFLRYKNFPQKEALVMEKARQIKTSAQQPTYSTARDKRHKITHLGVGSDIEVFESITMNSIEEAEKAVTEWIESTSSVLGKITYISTEAALDDFDALGTTTAEEYSGEL